MTRQKERIVKKLKKELATKGLWNTFLYEINDKKKCTYTGKEPSYNILNGAFSWTYCGIINISTIFSDIHETYCRSLTKTEMNVIFNPDDLKEIKELERIEISFDKFKKKFKTDNNQIDIDKAYEFCKMRWKLDYAIKEINATNLKMDTILTGYFHDYLLYELIAFMNTD